MNLIHYGGKLCYFPKDSYATKTKIYKWIVMKFIIAFLTIISVQMASAAKGQQVSLSFKNARLSDVLHSIRQQTGYGYSLPSENIQKPNPVSININSAPLETALQSIFFNQPFYYKIADNIILIGVKTAEKQSETQRLQDIEGSVLDQDSKPLELATILLKGTNRGTMSNAAGNFVLKNVPSDGTLIITLVGYESTEIKYHDGIVPMIVLKQINRELKEIVVVNKGYYTQKEELNTGSVGRVTSDIISKQPISNPLVALQGRLPGIYITQTSGVTGSPLNINIRGRNSLRDGASEPLYIVDGIPFNSASLSQTENATYLSQLSPFNSIRPEDIESIDVLRDADATAIYGSRGANGVVLITTKRGSVGKTNLNVSVYSGASKVTKFLDLMNSQEYLEMRLEGLKNDKRNPAAFENDVNGGWAADNNINKYTDWQKLLISGTARITNASASITGGNNSLQYLVGLSYRKETTVFPGEFENKIGSANASITHNSENKKLQVTTAINYSNNNNAAPTADLTRYIFQAPNAPDLYDANGNLNWQNNRFNNPLGILKRRANSIAENIIGNITARYTILDGLDFKANIGYNSLRLNENNYRPFTSYIPSSSPASEYRRLTLAVNDVRSWITEPQLNYKKTFGKHHIDALLGTTFQSSQQKGFLHSAYGFSSDILIENVAAATFSSGLNNNSDYRYTAFLARIGYNYDEKYVLNLTGRRDGSSRFGPGEQFGNFGAIGVAWIFSKEKWLLNNLPFLSFGKVRGSIGKTGNDQISDYSYLSAYTSPNGYYGTSGIYPATIGNPYYHWETINKIEAALELGFLQNNIRLNSSIYRNRTDNQLVGFGLPSFTGFNSIIANLPAVIQNSGAEFTISTNNISKKNFSWSTSANLTIPKNKLIKYDNLENSYYANYYRIGYPLSVSLLYKYKGIDETTGLYTFEDLDKNGTATSELDKYPVFVGQKFYGGMNNTFTLHGLTLDVFFQFVKQTGRDFVGGIAVGRYALDGSNMPAEFLDRWQKAGDMAKYQKYAGGSGATATAFNNFTGSDGTIRDASFVRLKNVSLSWQLPETWIRQIKLKNVRIYAQGQNLLTFTKFDGLDPETTSLGNYISLPTLRSITAGLQISL
ncbi:SusC/RagA family TonB-linked outer membrane protein [Pedobacter sp. PWIIR3]